MTSYNKFSASAPREIAPRTFRFVASTPEPDCVDDVIELSAWHLDAYRRNPVVLTGHDRGRLPVARASRVAIEGGALVVDVEFPPEGTSRDADEAFALVQSGYLRSCSVGFRALEPPIPIPGGGSRFTSVELLELSLVALGCNASAMALSRGRCGAGPIVVDGRPLTMELLGEILREDSTPSYEAAKAAFHAGGTIAVSPELIVTATCQAIAETIAETIGKAAGSLDGERRGRPYGPFSELHRRGGGAFDSKGSPGPGAPDYFGKSGGLNPEASIGAQLHMAFRQR